MVPMFICTNAHYILYKCEYGIAPNRGFWLNAGMKRATSASGTPRILVTIPTANFTHRKILEGILDYARAKGPWQFHLNTGDIAAQGMKRVENWKCSGIIALSSNKALLRRLVQFRKPTVFINPPDEGKVPPHGCVFVRRDDRNLGRLAAEYFISGGFRSFAFVGTSRQSTWSDERRDGFTARLAQEGFTCIDYGSVTPEESADAAIEAPRLLKWLKTLPPQTALFTVKDIRGQQILSACLDASICVPEDLAVLSTDDDKVLCGTISPPLSSISLDGENTGKLCAGILDNLLHGKKVEAVVDIMCPRIITRRSSDVTAVDDPLLARALGYARTHLDEPFRISKLASDTGISVRTIELKARKQFGHPFREEILRLRLAKAVSLLSNTGLPAADIAAMCGFCSGSHLSRSVKDAFGHPPSTFRPKPTRHLHRS